MKNTKTITFANFKGGTGKTTNACMLAYALSNMGKKVLLVDHDPQADATSFLLKTYKNINGENAVFDKTLMMAIKERNLEQIVIKVKDDLDLLPSFHDFINYPMYLEKTFPGYENQPKRESLFKDLLQPFHGVYDYIFIDVPPTFSTFTNGALYASNSVILVMQTQERSLKGAEIFVTELQRFVDETKHFVSVSGVLPVIMKKDSKIDRAILKYAAEGFGEENIFKTHIKQLERLKRWDISGITNNPKDIHDKRTHDLYVKLAKEFLNRNGEK